MRPDTKARAAFLAFLIFLSSHPLARAQGKGPPVEHPTSYRTVKIDGLSIFYREAGPKNAPTLLLLHGLPSSSRMFEPLFDAPASPDRLNSTFLSQLARPTSRAASSTTQDERGRLPEVAGVDAREAPRLRVTLGASTT